MARSKKRTIHMMKIAVLLPAFNCDQYVAEAIQSIAMQTCKNIKVFARNDASSDYTGDVMSKALEESMLEYAYVDGLKNLGWCASYNQLADAAYSEGFDYVFIMGADDTMHPTCLETMLRAVEDADFCSIYGREFGGARNLVVPADPETLTVEHFKEQNKIANFALISMAMWKSLHGYNTAFTHYADWEFWIRALKAKFKYQLVKDALYNYRIHPDQTSKKANHEAIHNLIIQTHF